MEQLTIGSRYLFDTCVFIDIVNKRKPATYFYHQTRFDSVFAAYSIVTETELLQWQGITAVRNEYRETTLLKAYHRHYVTVKIARDAGRFSRKLHNDFYELKEQLKKQRKQPDKKDNPPGLIDCLIAATAKFYNLRLLSRDEDMSKFRQFHVTVDMYKLQR